MKGYPKHWQLPKFTVHEFKKKSSDYCVCIPVLNEGEKIKKQLRKMKPLSKVVDIIMADWGSDDGSMKKTFLKQQGVRTLLTKKSEGKQATQLRMAFAYSMNNGYKGVIQVDGNNKDGVDAIPEFIKQLKRGHHYLQGSRFVDGGVAVNTPLTRLLGIRLVVSPILSLASGYWYTDVTNGFRAYSAEYLNHPEVLPFRDVFVGYNMNFYLCVRANQLGLKTKELPVSRVYPKGKVPTKMNNFRSQLRLVEETVHTALGSYHP